MAQLTYPGVYVQEVPSGVRPVSTVATSIAAFIGFFREGEMNAPVEINGMGDFDRIFGGIDRRSPASYGISQFFLNGGGKAIVVRVAAGSPARASVGAESHPSAGLAQLDSMTVQAVNEGEWGNTLRFTITPNAASGTFNMTVTRHEGTQADSPARVTETFLNLSPNPESSRYFPDVVNDESRLVEVVHTEREDDLSDGTADTDPDDYRVPAATGTVGKPITAAGIVDIVNDTVAAVADLPSAIAELDDMGFGIETEAPDGTSISGRHTAKLSWNGTAPTDLRQLRGHLERAIRKATLDADSTQPTHPSLAGATVALVHDAAAGEYRYVVRSADNVDAYSPAEIVNISTAATPSDPDPADVLGFKGGGICENVQAYVLGTTADPPGGSSARWVGGTAGSDGLVPDADALLGEPDPKTGMYALKDADLFNILCIPRAAELDDAEMTTVVSRALTFCEEQRAFMLIDMPENVNEVQEAKDWLDAHAGFRHRNAATYFPRLRIPDPENEYRLRSVGPSGTMAGVYARFDNTTGVWRAPAGIDGKLRGVSELDVKLTDDENGSLNPLAINCARVFPIHGPVAWGARTLMGADVIGSEWKYIPVRRLALMLEESLFRGTKWVVFAPNDEPTWAKIRQNVGAFMMRLFRQGAFQGSTPNEAFYVRCDGETTPPADRNLGIVNIEVGFAALKPAEFVVLKIQQIPDVA